MTRSAKKKPDLLDLLPEEIDRLFGALGIEPYRTTQIVQWLYKHGARSFGEIAITALRKVLGLASMQ